jgi:hypothetical protein
MHTMGRSQAAVIRFTLKLCGLHRRQNAAHAIMCTTNSLPWRHNNVEHLITRRQAQQPVTWHENHDIHAAVKP